MKKFYRMEGMFPPLITPFKDSGEIDEKKLKKLINFLLEKGVHGLFIGGSYGSYPLLTMEERKKLAEMVFAEVNERVPVIVQVATPCTAHSVELTKHAADLGAKAVASVYPYYYSAFAYDEKDLLGYFKALVDASDIAVHLYNNPKATGYATSTKFLLKLNEVGVTGLKDSAGDIMLLSEHIREFRNRGIDFSFAIGTTGMLLAGMALGVTGCVAGTANALPELMVELYNTLLKKNLEESAAIQLKVIEVRKLQNIQGFRPVACYSMLKMRGLDMGTCRKPWRELDPENYKIVEQRLRELGLL
ncbi:MAG: hypothetical protein A2096_09555 [Spirochaetes bacterium GWF1_41_5]|nr:MAG: hypothetical protein A2096_09555 [Spirochaetes bacterium GWF1_41_5]